MHCGIAVVVLKNQKIMYFNEKIILTISYFVKNSNIL